MRTGEKDMPRSRAAGNRTEGTGRGGREGGDGRDGLDKMGRGYSRGLCMVNITVPQMQKVSSGEISIWG